MQNMTYVEECHKHGDQKQPQAGIKEDPLDVV